MTRKRNGDFDWDGNGHLIDMEDLDVISGLPPAPRAKSVSCWRTHTPLELGGGVMIGGNCERHIDAGVTADLYVALESYHKHPLFDPDKAVQPVSLYYPIENMRAPKNADKFSALVELIIGHLAQGHTVHVGCIGGHGRTGLVIAAVAARLGEKDPIRWVRANYCHRAVESREQEGYLVANFGAKPGSLMVDKRVGRR